MEHLLSLPHAAYVASVIAIGLLAIFRAAWWLRRTERERQSRLEHRRMLNPITTATPVDDPVAAARGRGKRSIADQTRVARRVLYPALLLLTAVAATVPFLGQAPASTVSIVAAAITVLVGIAARPVVENAFAGLVVSMSKLINIGDTVMLDGQYGNVEDISITHTTIRIWDWRRYVVPNTAMLQSRLINYSLYDGYIWARVEFWVAPDSDMARVRELALSAARDSDHFAGHEDPQFWVMEMDKVGVRCWVAAWANHAADAWMFGHDVRTRLVVDFQAHGIHAQRFRHADADAEAAAPRPVEPAP